MVWGWGTFGGWAACGLCGFGWFLVGVGLVLVAGCRFSGFGRLCGLLWVGCVRCCSFRTCRCSIDSLDFFVGCYGLELWVGWFSIWVLWFLWCLDLVYLVCHSGFVVPGCYLVCLGFCFDCVL